MGRGAEGVIPGAPRMAFPRRPAFSWGARGFAWGAQGVFFPGAPGFFPGAPRVTGQRAWGGQPPEVRRARRARTEVIQRTFKMPPGAPKSAAGARTQRAEWSTLRLTKKCRDCAPKVRTIKPRPQPGRRGHRLPPLDRVNVRPIYTPPEPRPPPRTRPLRSPARPSVATKYCAAQAPVLSRGFRGRFESAAHSRKVRFFFRGNSTSAACIRKYPKHRGDLFRGV